MILNKNLKIFISLLSILFFISIASAETQIWQGKYLTGNINSDYVFNFTVYDSLTGGNVCYTNQTTLTTNSDKWWDTYQYNVATSCSNSSIDYYLNINIDSVDQTPRRFLKQLKYADMSGNVQIYGNLHMIGTITHDSPVEVKDGLALVDANGNDMFHLEVEGKEDHNEVPIPALNNTLIFETISIENIYNMQVAFWDSINYRPTLILNQGGTQRSSVFDRSVMIGKSLGNATIDENYTKCQGFNLIDCNTNETGADLGVEDDIEAKGSIYSQENINATGNFSLGQKIVFALGEVIDNIIDGWITINGGLNVTDNLIVDGNLTVAEYLDTEVFHANNYITTGNNFKFNFYDDGSDLFMNVSNGGGDFAIEQENTKISLFNNPSFPNDYKVFEVFSRTSSFVSQFVISKDGMNLADYHTRSLQVGGKTANCSTMTNLVGCDTSITGSDLLVEDEIWNGGALFLVNGSVNITDLGNIITIGNTTSNFYFGDGSQLTGISSVIWENISGIATYSGGVNIEGDYAHQGNMGFTGNCINVTYSGGIAISCND